MSQNLWSLLGVGLALVSLGIVFLTTEKIGAFPIMTEVRRLYAGWSSLSLGIIMSVLAVVIGLSKFLSRASTEFHLSVSPKLLERFEYEFDEEYCDAEGIKDVLALDNSVLHRLTLVDEAFLKQKHNINNQIIRCIRKKKFDTNILVGFYIIYPINKDAEQLIEQGYIAGSRMFRNEHICSDFKTASSVYVSMVYGRDMPTRGFTVYLLKRDLKQILRNTNHLNHIYTSPNSSEGFLLAKKYGFTPMSINPDIWRLPL